MHAQFSGTLHRMSKRAYQYRFYPTPEQALLLEKTFGCVRFVYNHILGEDRSVGIQQQALFGLWPST